MMHAKTMEGLVGARDNMNLMNTPMRVFREAKQKGDTAAMERALGYAGECSDKAWAYKAAADRGMEEDAEEAREKLKLQREEAIRKRKEEREELEERIERRIEERTKETSEGNRNAGIRADAVEISEEGKVLAEDSVNTAASGADAVESKSGAAKGQTVYTKAGEAVPVEQGASISLSV